MLLKIHFGDLSLLSRIITKNFKHEEIDVISGFL